MYPPFPPTFPVGPFTIHWYGIFMAIAVFVAPLIASRYVRRRGQDGDRIWSMLFWVLIPALIGARLYFVFIQSSRGPTGLGYYLYHPLQILAIWNLIGFALISWLARRFDRNLRDGDILLIYLLWYPLGRFFLEFLRSDSWFFPGTPFNVVHIISAIVVLTSAMLLILRHRNWPGRGQLNMAASEEDTHVAGAGLTPVQTEG